MAIASEFETKPVAPEQLQKARQFAASYAGEHVAGTEFVIGALFVAWGVSTHDILYGLLIGNLLAVLTWGLVTAPFDLNVNWLPRDSVAVDAIPDIGENQQIVYTKWMGRSCLVYNGNICPRIWR